MDCCALLDDRDASPAQPTSRLYTGFVRGHVCADPRTLDAMWAAVESDLKAGLYALVLADYEWGAKLQRAGHAKLAADDASALRVLLFKTMDRCSRADADRWLASLDGGQAMPSPAGVIGIEASVDRDSFHTAIAAIHEAIAAGETYQVNYTYRIDAQAHGTPIGLYRRLRARQPVAYGAFVALPPTVAGEGQSASAQSFVLSCSPELFLRNDRGVLTARPMKGTASRDTAPESDSETARHLWLDIKNRAENLMIVDLLRNDIGRVSEIGSVKVPELFAVEPYSTVFQMTSTVQSRLRDDVGFAELLRAVFPCGSITGAPKHHTMELIAGLESTPRGLYTGAIGWIEPPEPGAARRCGDFCLSVAIRTLTLDAVNASSGQRPARLGVGAGIVKDSVAADEFEECRLKARFLTGLDPGFALFETMHATREAGVRHLDRHLARLNRSAAALGFRCDRGVALAAIDRQVSGLPSLQPMRLRLELRHDGHLETSAAPLLELGDVVLVIEAETPLERPDALAAHKTTRRQHYDAGVRAAESAGAFDSLFFTADGFLVEGGRSNVFIKLDGRWWTPPLADSVLPGVMRGLLLDDAQWQAAERRVHRDDLQRAEAIVVCNALRGAMPARLLVTGDVTQQAHAA